MVLLLSKCGQKPPKTTEIKVTYLLVFHTK